MTDFYIPTPEKPGHILVVDDLPGNLKVRDPFSSQNDILKMAPGSSIRCQLQL